MPLEWKASVPAAACNVPHRPQSRASWCWNQSRSVARAACKQQQQRAMSLRGRRAGRAGVVSDPVSVDGPSSVRAAAVCNVLVKAAEPDELV
jgi:hypothetical protein